MATLAKSFYDEQYLQDEYARPVAANEHGAYFALSQFVECYELHHQRCLEVGCGRGAFQDLVVDYTGVDISDTVRRHLRKPFVQASATELPFADGEFDALWSVWTLEHVKRPEAALREIRRVLRTGGLAFLWPAWQCRSWAAQGYPVRPYTDFDWKGKIIKASIPLRNSIFYRALKVFPNRLVRFCEWAGKREPTQLACQTLAPNRDHYWMSDSDAVNSLDPFEVILWFVSRGDECLSLPTSLSQLLVRTGPLVISVNK